MIALWSTNPVRYQPRTAHGSGIPLLADANEAAFLLQRLYQLCGYPLPDFGETLTDEQRQRLEALAKQLVAEKKFG
jgi:hypothetical protein